MIDTHTNWNYTKFQFEKILLELSSFALSEEGKNNILNTKVLTDFDIIEKNYAILKDLIDYIKYEEDKIEIFKIFDIKEYLQEVGKGIILDAKKIYKICYNIKLYFNLKEKIGKYKDKYRNLNQILTLNNSIDSFYKEVLKYIDEDGNIDSNISKGLKEIREEIANIEVRIKSAVNEFFNNAKKNDYVVDDIISFRENFPCVGIKVSYKNRVNGIVIDYSTTGQTAFIVPNRVIELNNELVIAREREIEEIRKILKNYSELIKYLDQKFTRIDERFDEMKKDFVDLQTSVDAYAKRADTYFQEMVALSYKVDRHERWIKQIADKLGIKLEY